MTDEEKKELKELINLMYNNHISQYGKRKLEKYIEKQQKEIEELKEINEEMGKALDEWINGERTSIFHIHKDKIKAKIEEVDYKMIAHQDVREAVKQALQSLLEKE